MEAFCFHESKTVLLFLVTDSLFMKFITIYLYISAIYLPGFHGDSEYLPSPQKSLHLQHPYG